MNSIGYSAKLLKQLIPNPLKRQGRSIGSSPDELVFWGVQRRDNVELTLIEYDENNVVEKTLENIEECKDLIHTDKVSWLNVSGLHDDRLISKLGELLDIESYILADILNTELRPKVQEFDNYMFISMKMMMYDHENQFIDVEHLSIILRDKLLVSFQEKEGDVFEPIRQRIRDQKRRIRSNGTDYLAFAMMDIVIDNYIYTTSSIGEKIESLEVKLLEDASSQLLSGINLYKKEVNYLRRNIKPALEMVTLLSKLETPFIKKKSFPFFKELVDNSQMASELTDSYSEILNDQLNFYHTTMSSKLNEVMKFLTIFSVVFIPLTFIAGVYGTNFKNLPEIDYKYGYFIMLGLMAIVAIFMIIYFKRKKWM